MQSRRERAKQQLTENYIDAEFRIRNNAIDDDSRTIYSAQDQPFKFATQISNAASKAEHSTTDVASKSKWILQDTLDVILKAVRSKLHAVLDVYIRQ